MAQVKDGSKVKVHYKGSLADGTVFDQSAADSPLEFKVGEGQIIPGFEEAVREMSVGEKRTVKLEVDQAYGPHREELVGAIKRERLPENIAPEVGQMLRVGEPHGQSLTVQVVEVDDDEVKLDGNHPLAGRDLTFQIELVGVE